MDRMEFNIFFEKSFWTGLCIRYTDDSIFTARYIFGHEPSNGEILDFYLNSFDSLLFVECSYAEIVKTGKTAAEKRSFKKSLHKGINEQKRGKAKSAELYSAGLSKYLEAERKKSLKKAEKSEKEKYLKKQQKKKDRKKGH